jgi:hypothetical protein
MDVVGVKKNGQRQSDNYFESITGFIRKSTISQSETTSLFPFWHAIALAKLWKCGPRKFIENTISFLSPQFKVWTVGGMLAQFMKCAFRMDCFDVYYQSGSHKMEIGANKQQVDIGDGNGNLLKPLVLDGGT